MGGLLGLAGNITTEKMVSSGIFQHTYMVGFNALPVLPTTFQPNWFSGNQLWLNPTAGITLNGAKVTQWNDLSGNGRNVSQATTANKPTYNTTDAAYNNQSTLGFAGPNGGNHQVLTSTAWSLAQPSTFIVVGQADQSATMAFFDFQGTETALYFDTTHINAYAGAVLSKTATSTSPGVFTAQFNGNSSAIFKNNSQTAIVSGAAGAGTATSGIIVGALQGSVDPLNGKIAEVIIFNRILTANEMSTVFSYLGSRYNISVS